MDTFAKRGAIAAVSLMVISGLAVGVGIYRARGKLEHDSKLAGAPPPLAAAISFPTPVVAAGTAAPAAPKEVVSAPKQDLASAFGAALGIDPSKVAAHTAPPAASVAPVPQRTGSSDTLELGFAASDRDAKLGNRDAKPYEVHHTGSSGSEHKDTPR